MVIIEKPYVSEHMLSYLGNHNIAVLKNEFSNSFAKKYNLNLVDDKKMIELYNLNNKLYTSSENALDWVYKNLSDDNIIEMIDIMKDKCKFRELIRTMYPDYYFKEVTMDELVTLDSDLIEFPVVLKPSVGFYSVGVYSIFNKGDWNNAVREMKLLYEEQTNKFPDSVVGLSNFIIEEYIEGIEYAIDAYFDKDGNPIILNIFTHKFASKNDVSDRIYYTSKEIIETLKSPIEDFFKQVNKKLHITNFPMHVEIRVKDNKIMPIEFNPMRFAGLCTTDIAYYAYGINTIEYFLENKVPNFNEILEGKDDILYSLILLDKKESSISNDRFDYEALKNNFYNVLELRKVHDEALNLFGFLFVETPLEKEQELDHILHSDLMEYVK